MASNKSKEPTTDEEVVALKTEVAELKTLVATLSARIAKLEGFATPDDAAAAAFDETADADAAPAAQPDAAA